MLTATARRIRVPGALLRQYRFDVHRAYRTTRDRYGEIDTSRLYAQLSEARSDVYRELMFRWTWRAALHSAWVRRILDRQAQRIAVDIFHMVP